MADKTDKVFVAIICAIVIVILSGALIYAFHGSTDKNSIPSGKRSF